jgi:large subunit ribosomal protein L25
MGKVPGIVYGHDMENMAIECDANTLHKVFVKAGESVLVELEVEGKKIPVLFKDISFHPVSSREMHVDFYAVNMKEEIETLVPVHFTGESLAIKDLSGVLLTPLTEVTVRCLPKDLPSQLVVDISSLNTFEDVILVKDIPLPTGVTVMDDPEALIAAVQEPRKEEEEPVVAAPAEGEAAAAAPAEGAAPAAEGEKKEEGK